MDISTDNHFPFGLFISWTKIGKSEKNIYIGGPTTYVAKTHCPCDRVHTKRYQSNQGPILRFGCRTDTRADPVRRKILNNLVLLLHVYLFFNLINLISISLSFFLQSLSLFSVSVTPPFHPLKLPFLSPFQTLQSAERKDRLGAPLLSASAFCLGLCIGLNYFRLFCLLAAL